MKRSPMPPRETPLERRTPLKGTGFGSKKKTPARRKRDEERKAREFARKFHSLERVFFVQIVLRCRVCGKRAENAHVEREGTGRKAHHTKIIGLCREHHRGPQGLDTISAPRFLELYPSLDPLGEQAARVERLWQEHGERVLAQAKADGTYQAWLEEGRAA